MGRDLMSVAKFRKNIVPIIEDARHPYKYRMLMSMVDVIFADVAQPDQARIVGFNAQHYLKAGGHVVFSIKAACVDSTIEPAKVYQMEVKRLQDEGIKPIERVDLDRFERGHALVTGVYE